MHWVINQLKDFGYEKVLSQNYGVQQSSHSINDIVKSYFWASRLISKNLCLPRSIGLYQCLKKNGYEVEHKFGVNTSNNQFTAHAWVEHLGQPLNEHRNLYLRFKVLKK